MLNAETSGPVLTLTLNRPEVRNAINDELIAALADAIADAPQGTRVIVIRGEGKAFCAGGDLEWMRRAASYTEEQNIEDALRLANLFDAIVSSPAVVIAQVHGAAFGGGAGLTAACDVAVASSNTLFAFSEAKLGLVAATISPYVLNKIGPGHTRALFVTAEPFDAKRAFEIGLVHQVVEADELEASVRAKVQAVLKCGPQAVAASKAIAVWPPKSQEETAKLLARARAGDEGKEGVTAFLEKRPASFVVEL
jgi:enoyl-CoA hydratase/carnithine racemase